VASSAFSLNFWLRSACLPDLCKTCTGISHEVGAAQYKVAHGVLVGLALLGVECRTSMALYLANSRSSAPNRVQNSVTRGKAALSATQVGSRPRYSRCRRAPSHAQSLGCHVQHLGNGAPLRGKLGGRHCLKRFRCSGQQNMIASPCSGRIWSNKRQGSHVGAMGSWKQLQGRSVQVHERWLVTGGA